MKFSTEVQMGSRAEKSYAELEKLKDFTLKARDEEYDPPRNAPAEEKEAVAFLRENPEAFAIIEETQEPGEAYSRAAALRIAKTKPAGTWEFAGRKVEGDDETESGVVLARFLSIDEPTEGGDEEE